MSNRANFWKNKESEKQESEKNTWESAMLANQENIHGKCELLQVLNGLIFRCTIKIYQLSPRTFPPSNLSGKPQAMLEPFCSKTRKFHDFTTDFFQPVAKKKKSCQPKCNCLQWYEVSRRPSKKNEGGWLSWWFGDKYICTYMYVGTINYRWWSYIFHINKHLPF